MILGRTQKSKSLLRNLQVTRADFHRPIILWLTRPAVVVLMVARFARFLSITRFLAVTASATSASGALLWPIILSAILVRAVMSAVLMMSCTHGNVRTAWSQATTE